MGHTTLISEVSENNLGTIIKREFSEKQLISLISKSELANDLLMQKLNEQDRSFRVDKKPINTAIKKPLRNLGLQEQVSEIVN